MVLVKMLMEIALLKMGELLVMMMTMISPSGREVPPVESLRRRAKVLLPEFRLETAALTWHAVVGRGGRRGHVRRGKKCPAARI